MSRIEQLAFMAMLAVSFLSVCYCAWSMRFVRVFARQAKLSADYAQRKEIDIWTSAASVHRDALKADAAAMAAANNADLSIRGARFALDAERARKKAAAEADPLQAVAVQPLPEEPPPAGPRRRGRASILRAYFDRPETIARLYREDGNPVG